MDRKKILVTGGAGFIGSHLVKRLVKENFDVIVIDNLLRGNKIDSDTLGKIKFVEADVRDYDIVETNSIGCEYIFHLAAVLGVDIVADNPVETMEVEVVGTRNVCHAAMQNGVRKVLYASTSGIYGHSAMESAVTENIVVDPKTSYAMAKRFNEIYLVSFFEEKGLESVSLRFFNVYGPNQDNRMVIPRFIEQAKAGEDITVFGSGKQTRDFTYIDDTIESCLQLMHKSSGADIFNIANEKEGCIEDLAVAIKEILNSTSEIVYIEAPKKRYDYEVERRVGNSDKLFQATGFKPQVELADGLRKIIVPVS
jgi:nucleoside-diphosphate-sugar epimerase